MIDLTRRRPRLERLLLTVAVALLALALTVVVVASWNPARADPRDEPRWMPTGVGLDGPTTPASWYVWEGDELMCSTPDSLYGGAVDASVDAGTGEWWSTTQDEVTVVVTVADLTPIQPAKRQKYFGTASKEDWRRGWAYATWRDMDQCHGVTNEGYMLENVDDAAVDREAERYVSGTFGYDAAGPTFHYSTRLTLLDDASTLVAVEAGSEAPIDKEIDVEAILGAVVDRVEADPPRPRLWPRYEPED